MVQPLAVLHALSALTLVLALAMGAPLVVAELLDDGARFAFEGGMLATACVGALIRIVTQGRQRELRVRDGFLLVASGWAGLPALAALPLIFYFRDLSFTRAYFEAVSGLTTTGATVLVGLDSLPPSINFWRCQLQWMGGMGIIVLAVAILPMLGVGGAQLFKAETPGPMKDNKLTPRMTETAKALWLVYGGITVACALAMKFAGMDWLDAVMHAFTTMSLGGMSSHDASFAYWNSPVLEAVTIVFMLLAGMNFSTHFLAIRKHSIAVYARDPEVPAYLSVLLASVLVIAGLLWWTGVYAEWGTALRTTAFNVVSVATTTGYTTVDFGLWPVFAPMWMLILSSFVSCTGSTGAGIKMMRARLMAQQAAREMRRILHPQAIIPIRFGERVVENQIIFAVLAFMLVYGTCVVAVTLLLALSGLNIVTAFSATMACINNMGPGLNEVGPASTYAGLTNLQLWLLSATMLLGRLEMFTLLIVFTPAFWRK
jgi:trk system potassium uptake protein TrkH